MIAIKRRDDDLSRLDESRKPYLHFPQTLVTWNAPTTLSLLAYLLHCKRNGELLMMNDE